MIKMEPHPTFLSGEKKICRGGLTMKNLERLGIDAVLPRIDFKITVHALRKKVF
jgi:hypothetical protein